MIFSIRPVQVQVQVLLGVVLVALAACTPEPADSGDGPAEAASPDVAGGDIDVRVRSDDFAINLTLDGVSAASSEVVLASDPQLVFAAATDHGTAVSEGDVVGRWHVANDRDLPTGRGRQVGSIDAQRLERLRNSEGEAKAPVGGVLELEGGPPRIVTDGIDVVAALTPLQQLRFLSTTFNGSATVETTLGQRSVPCTALWTTPVGEEPEPGVAVSESSQLLHCRLPNWVETAPGIRAKLSVASEVISDAILVPNLYVGYDADVDGYYVLIEGQRVPVTTGLTDGVVRVITSELVTGAPLSLPESVP